MPDLRKDPIVGRWVIVAKNRAKRPHEIQVASRRRSGGFCPFCEGQEVHTPNEILAYRDPGTAPNAKGWRIRVVPNKFPALEIEGDLELRGDGMYDMMRGVGAHEVIVESPRHIVSTAELSEDQLRDVYWVYRDRLLDLQRDRRILYGMLFKNVGAAAGASLEHTHSQLIATPIVPTSVREEMTGAATFFTQRGRCIYCDMIRQELDADKRVVLDTPSFLAFCPFASRVPFETWVIPKRHASHFESIDESGIHGLAKIMREVVGRIESAVENPAYNYIVHTSPFDVGDTPHYHWHVEIMPRLTSVAGFEWGTGFYINPVPPEEAAAFLRDVTRVPPARPHQRSRAARKSTTTKDGRGGESEELGGVKSGQS